MCKRRSYGSCSLFRYASITNRYLRIPDHYSCLDNQQPQNRQKWHILISHYSRHWISFVGSEWKMDISVIPDHCSCPYRHTRDYSTRADPIYNFFYYSKYFRNDWMALYCIGAMCFFCQSIKFSKCHVFCTFENSLHSSSRLRKGECVIHSRFLRSSIHPSGQLNENATFL